MNKRIFALTALSAMTVLAGCKMTGGDSAAISLKEGQQPAAVSGNQPLTSEEIMAIKAAEQQAQQTQAAVEKPTAQSGIPAATRAPTTAKISSAGCPAAPLSGKWMSKEVRQGSQKQLVPVAIGYMFQPDGYFATALFDATTGEKQGEFDGRYRTVKNSAGKCVLRFDVPNAKSPVGDIGYSVNKGQLIITDAKSQSRAVLGRI